MNIKSWFRRLSAITLSIIFSLTLLSLPAHALGQKLDPTFDPQKVNLGITPTVWSNSDDRTIDLNPPIPYQQILSEIALSGFVGTQMAPKFGEVSLDVLKSELKLRNVVISEPWVSTFFTEGKRGRKQTIREFRKQVEFMKEMGGNTIAVAEMGGSVHQKNLDPFKNKPKWNDEQWVALAKGLNEIGKIANDNNMKLVYHHHIGTGVDNLEDIDRLMTTTDPQYVNLLLDTGHLQYAGVNPLVVAKKYINRIKHVHLKNIRQPVLEASKAIGRSFLNSIRAGIFTVPGDQRNSKIDFPAILQVLADAKYQGWLIVEAEQDPNQANPLQYAKLGREYLKTLIGW